jgi:hypothetical protein
MAVTATGCLVSIGFTKLISPMAQFAPKVDFWIPALHDHPNTRLTTWISVLDAFGDCRLYRVSHVPHIAAAEDGQSI